MTDLSKILYHQDFDKFPSGFPLNEVPGFSACNNGSIIDSLTFGGQTGKAVRTWIGKGKEGWADWGFAFDGPLSELRLSSGDEIWWRVGMHVPTGTDLRGDHGSLKTFRIGRRRKSDDKSRGYIDVQIRNDRNWRSIVEYDHDQWEDYYGGQVEDGVGALFEVYVKLHATDGIIRIFKDGRMFGETVGIPTLSAGSNEQYVDRLLLHTFWNGGSPKLQEHYIDEMAIAVVSPTRDDRPHLERDPVSGNYMIGTAGVGEPIDPPVDPVPPEPPEVIEGGITMTHGKTMIHIGDDQVVVTSDKPVSVI